jgi:RNA recognition motif-containing protein
LRRLFEKHGTVENIVAKRNRNSEYCFAFVEMKDHAAAAECVKA